MEIEKNKTKKEFIPLGKLEVYLLSRQLSDIGWEVYDNLSWQDKKVMGDQFIRATDSVGANIAEGYSRFHYLDKIKFYYNARGSLTEANFHWLELLKKRDKIDNDRYNRYSEVSHLVEIKLNNFITATYKAKERNT